MTIKNAVKGKADAQLCHSGSHKAMIVHVEFLNGKKEDETSFDLMAGENAIDDLDELFTEFCKENNLKPDSVKSVSVVATAKTMEELQKINK